LSSFTNIGDIFYGTNQSTNPNCKQRWDSPYQPDGDGIYVEAVFQKPDLLWNDLASPFGNTTQRAVMCSIDPVYHQSSNGKFYKVYYEPNGGLINAINAQKICEKRGGTLAITYNPTDYNATAHIRQQILNTDTELWIAGTDAINEGKCVMPDGNN
jgi:hypothetical protein